MKHLVRRCVEKIVKRNGLWKCLDSSLIQTGRYATWARRSYEASGRWPEHDIALKTREVFPDLTVRHGPFKGMQYVDAKSFGSALFPKLIGSYERELHPWIEELCETAYTEIVDIGCAEGYYAIGLGMRIPSSHVYAFDVNKDALELCRQMAEINEIGARFTQGEFCDSETLTGLHIRERGLVVADCEGYELDLFTEPVVKSMQKCDFLIEIHNCVDLNIAPSVADAFSATHDIRVLESIHDTKKAKTYDYPETADEDLRSRRRLFAEHRKDLTEWFLARPRPEKG